MNAGSNPNVFIVLVGELSSDMPNAEPALSAAKNNTIKNEPLDTGVLIWEMLTRYFKVSRQPVWP